MEEGIKASGMQDVKEFYVEVSNLTSYSVRHYSMINVISFYSYHSQYLISNFNAHVEVAYSIWSARDILKAQIENVIQSLIPGSRFHWKVAVICSVNMDALVRIRFGIVHLVYAIPLIDHRKQIVISYRFLGWFLMMKIFKINKQLKPSIRQETTIYDVIETKPDYY